tara:strand:- start:149 stop:910 length:762 start_codon:yes stop_codon:yes gene_type:complete
VSEIPDISIRDANTINIEPIQIKEIEVPPPPFVLPLLGFPIVDIPGCVEAHEDANKGNTGKSLVSNDKEGVLIYCNGETFPNYTPMDMPPYGNTLGTPPVPNRNNEKEDSTEEELKPTIPTPPKRNDCPPAGENRTGELVNEGKQRISGYQLTNQKCITLYEDVPIVTQMVNGLPDAGVVVTTTSIAVVATSSAIFAKPLADIVLKAIKPTVKTVMKKVQKILGKKPVKLTQTQVAANSYREKKGLPPLKMKK